MSRIASRAPGGVFHGGCVNVYGAIKALQYSICVTATKLKILRDENAASQARLK